MTVQEQAVRQELLGLLEELGRHRPEWRLGQLLANLAMVAGRLDRDGVWELEDGDALSAARSLLERAEVPAGSAEIS
ncbi:MAG: hypothetical protein ACRCZF_03900 [Gemmataceae bacterium]